MKKFPLSLKSGMGGLNTRDHPAGLQADEFQRLENYYGDLPGTYLIKRKGKQLIQYAPINPSVFVSDASTIGLWHLDEANPTSAAIDASGNGYTMNNMGAVGGTHGAPSQPVLLPIGAPLGRQAIGAFPGLATAGGSGQDGSSLFAGSAAVLDGLGALTAECWVNIPATYTGAPIAYSRGPLSGNPFIGAFSNSGAHIFGTTGTIGLGIGVAPYKTVNGFQLWRNWDPINLKDATDPYVTFQLKTKGILGTNTIVTSMFLPTGKMLHLRATYDGTTGLLSIYVNAQLHAQAHVVGAGPVDDSASGAITAFGALVAPADEYGLASWLAQSCAGVNFDEMRLSSIVRTDWPLAIPRGMGFEYLKSDGTRQAVVCADTALWYTVGNGEWQGPIRNNLSATADWDAAFQNDILYLCNGVDQPIAWDGLSAKDWGNPSIAAIANNTGTGNQVTQGVHRFVYTYLYGNYETGPSPYVPYNDLAGESVDITSILPRHFNCTAVRFYATAAGAVDGSPYYLYRQINADPVNPMQAAGNYVAGSPANYLNDTGGFGIPDASLGTSGYPQMAANVLTSAIRNPQFLCSDRSRMFMCGYRGAQYSLDWAEVGAPDVRRATSVVNADSNKGPLTAIASFYGEIQASKGGNATLVLRGTGPANWTQFETLHPDVGAIDHWSYVRRYTVNSDRYTLCFMGKDFFYEYAGISIRAISDKINGTFVTLAQNNATREVWSTETEPDFLSAENNGGGGTSNVIQPLYETDGIRQIPGQLQPINQLAYLAMRGQGNPLVTGNIIALEKGPSEGEFIFATDFDRKLYRTTDNFVTVNPIPGAILDGINVALGMVQPNVGTYDINSHRIIELKYASQGGHDTYWAFTSSRFAAAASDNGTPTAVGAGTLTDNTKSWAVNKWAGYYIRITADATVPLAVGQVMKIISNTYGYPATASVGVLTYQIPPSFVAPDTNATYEIVEDSPHGYVVCWDMQAGVWLNGSDKFGAGPYYWQNDTPFDLRSTPQPQYSVPDSSNADNTPDLKVFNVIGNGGSTPTLGTTNPYNPTGFAFTLASGNNAYLNHRQVPGLFFGANSGQAAVNISGFWFEGANANLTGVGGQNSNASNNSIFGNWTGFAAFNVRPYIYDTPSVFGVDIPSLSQGFYSIWDDESFINNTVANHVPDGPNNWVVPSTGGFEFTFTQRETAAWTGGSWRPQSFWDSVNGKLYFVAGSAENTAGNRQASIQQFDPTHAVYGALVTSNSTIAMCSDGLNCWFTIQNTTANQGFNTDLWNFPLLTGAVTKITTSGAGSNGVLPLRLVWNAQYGKLTAVGKEWQNIGNYDTWNFSGFVADLNTQNGNFTVLKSMTPNGVSGAYPQELAYQTTTPYLVFAAMNQVGAPDNEALIQVDDSPLLPVYGVANAAPYEGQGASAPVSGIISPLLFVPNTNSTLPGAYTWADRLYWYAPAQSPTDARLLQLGIPGTWTIKGTYVSRSNNLGAFTAFDDFEARFTGTLDFVMWNNNNPGALWDGNLPLDSGVPITPNQKISVGSFNPPGSYAQWAVNFTWNYSLAAPTLVPVLYYVDIAFFLGVNGAPRVVGVHYLGRTYWTVANAGADDNDLVLVYQKNNSWTSLTGWAMKSMFMFQGNLVGLEAANFVQLETGTTDMGNEIKTAAQTGTIMGDRDKTIEGIQANILSYVNAAFPNTQGYVKVTPYQGDSPLPAAAWVFPIPNSAANQPVRVQGVPDPAWNPAWARAFSLLIGTSDDTTGPFVPVIGQTEEIQSIDVLLDVTGPEYDIPVA